MEATMGPTASNSTAHRPAPPARAVGARTSPRGHSTIRRPRPEFLRRSTCACSTRASPWSRGGLARGSPVPHGIDWHGFVHVADVTYILTFGSLDSRRGSPPDLRSRVNLGISRRARMSGMSTAFKCRLKCTRRGWRSRPGVRPTGTGTRGPRVSVWISSRFARAESLLKWPK